MFTVEFILQLDDLKHQNAVAYGSVDEDENGKVKAAVRSIVTLLEIAPGKYCEWNCIHRATLTLIRMLEEKMTSQYEVAKAKGDQRCYDYAEDF